MSRARALRAAQLVGAVVTLGVAAAVYGVVGGAPGLLYAAGIVLIGLFAALRIRARAAADEGGAQADPAAAAPAERRRRRRKSVVIAELEGELSATRSELAAREQELAALRDRRAQEAETARTTEARLTARVHELEQSLERMDAFLASERERVELTLGTLSGGIDQRSHELAELERELEAIIA